MHFRDSPDSLNGLGIPGNIWFSRFAVTYAAWKLIKTIPEHKAEPKLNVAFDQRE